MRTYQSNEIGNVVVLGHAGCGKTSVIEAMLYRCGGSQRLGKVADGTTTSDYDAEELKRKVSINTSIIPMEWDNCKINILDTPGYFDFSGEVTEAIKVADSALIIVPATSGIAVGTEIAWERASHLPKIIFMNGLDDRNSSYENKLQELKDRFGKVIAPIQVPIIENGKMTGYVNVAKMEGRRFDGMWTVPCDIPESMLDAVEPVREMILEAVATTSDELLDKYMEGIEFTKEEISWALRKGVMNNEIVPVLCGTQTIGIQILLNSLVAFFPSAADTVNSFICTHEKTGEEEILGYNQKLRPSAFIFKTIADPFVGKISLFKVATGVIKAGMPLYNTKKQEMERPAKLYIVKGKELIEVDELYAGDIGAYSKLQYTQTNDTLCMPEDPITYEDMVFETPYFTKAIRPLVKGSEDKISGALQKLLEEDQTLKFETHPETKQQLLTGIGEQHLDITLSKLKSKFKIEIALEEARLPYRETIKGKAQVRGKHKKQSGGHGQYGDVEIIFEPSHDLTKPYVFEEKIFGGAVPKSYFPAVEKGLAECCDKGVLAGYPMVGLKATLVDGSYHDVDSSEMAFKLATALAYKDGIPKAKPVLLEPMVRVLVKIPEDYTGDIMGDFKKRRARVMGADQVEGTSYNIIEAEAPQATMMTYATDLRSMTQGRGSFEMKPLGYEQTPADVQKMIIERYSIK